MKFISEIDLNKGIHNDITELRNAAFPEHSSPNSYLKQLPHIRCVHYEYSKLVGYMGLDYRVMSVGGHCFKALGIIDFCVLEDRRGKGLGSGMLCELTDYANSKDVDFIVLVSDKTDFYERNGFNRLTVPASWLRLHQHKNYGVAFEYLNDFFVKPTGDDQWNEGHVDWLGYMY